MSALTRSISPAQNTLIARARKNENLLREFNKTVISQKRKGVKIWGVMINGERILSESTYIDSEIKQIFDALITETTDDGQYIYERAEARLRDTYRKMRVDMSLTGSQIISMEGGPKIYLHLIPVNAIESDEKLDLSELSGHSIPPINTSGWSHKFNFDGYLSYDIFPDREHAHSYTQIFFNGIIEAVDAFMLRERIIPSIAYEVELIKILPKYLETQEKIGAELPISIMLSLIAVKNCSMALPRGFIKYSPKIDRHHILIPEILIESFECDIECAKEIMRPIFDRVWNAVGMSRSMNYDEEGKWIR